MADAGIADMRRQGRDHPSRLARLESYPCPDCRAWHIGHGKQKPIARIA